MKVLNVTEHKESSFVFCGQGFEIHVTNALNANCDSAAIALTRSEYRSRSLHRKCIVRTDEIRCYYCTDCDDVSEDQLQTCSLDNVISFTTTTTVITTTGQPATITTEEQTTTESATLSTETATTVSSTDAATPIPESTTDIITQTSDPTTPSTLTEPTTPTTEATTPTTEATTPSTELATDATTPATQPITDATIATSGPDSETTASSIEPAYHEEVPSVDSLLFRKFPSVHRLRRSLRNDIRFVCVIVKTEENGDEITSRGCAVAADTDQQTCGNIGPTIECNVCNTDACNSATGLRLSFAALLVTIAIFYFQKH